MENESQVNTPEGGDQGNQNQESLGWRAGLPDDLKSNETFTPYKTVGEFAKNHIEVAGKAKELEGKLATAIFKPDEKATPEQMDAYYKAIGKPEKATDYEFPKLEGMERDPKFTKWAQDTFHQIGIPKEMGVKVAGAYDAFSMEVEKARNEAVVKARNEAEVKIKAELGEQYPVAVELAKRMLTKHAKPEELVFFDETGLGNHPVLIRMLFDFAKKTGDDTGISSSGGSGSLGDARDFYKGTGGK